MNKKKLILGLLCCTFAISLYAHPKLNPITKFYGAVLTSTYLIITINPPQSKMHNRYLRSEHSENRLPSLFREPIKTIEHVNGDKTFCYANGNAIRTFRSAHTLEFREAGASRAIYLALDDSKK